MVSWPVREIELLYGRTWQAKPADLSPGTPLRSEAQGDLLDIRATIETGKASAITLDVRGMPIRLDLAARLVTCGERTAPVDIRDGRVSVRVLADRTSLEVFVNEGEVAMLLAGVFIREGVTLAAEGGIVRAAEFRVHELRSAWETGR